MFQSGASFADTFAIFCFVFVFVILSFCSLQPCANVLCWIRADLLVLLYVIGSFVLSRFHMVPQARCSA